MPTPIPPRRTSIIDYLRRQTSLWPHICTSRRKPSRLSQQPLRPFFITRYPLIKIMTLESALPPPRPHRGGRRPGAGAPRGNFNAVKHGMRSERVRRGMIILSLLPEVVDALRALKQANAQTYRQRLLEAVLTANRAALMDPDLAQSIKALIQLRFQGCPGCRPSDSCPGRKMTRQSDNQRRVRIVLSWKSAASATSRSSPT